LYADESLVHLRLTQVRINDRLRQRQARLETRVLSGRRARHSAVLQKGAVTALRGRRRHLLEDPMDSVVQDLTGIRCT